MNKVEILIADDDPLVRETFKDLIVDYKKDLRKNRRDDLLGYLFDHDYKIYYDEAEDGVELESKIASRLEENPSQFFITFVDEDMPKKKGTDAIAGITELVYSLTMEHNRVVDPNTSRPKVRLISYTQKQDIDISEGIALESGAALFLRKTSLDDFYEEMIRIIEHMVLDLTNLDPMKKFQGSRKASLRLIGNSEHSRFEDFKEYLRFRYCKEVLVGMIERSRFNNAWINPDLGDFFSVPVGLYSSGDTPRLIACARLITTRMQSNSTVLLEELLDQCAVSMAGFEGNYSKPGDDAVRVDKYYINKDYIGYDSAGKILDFIVAFATSNGHSRIEWEVTNDLLPLAQRHGFEVSGNSDKLTHQTELNIDSWKGNMTDVEKFRECIDADSGPVEIELESTIDSVY